MTRREILRALTCVATVALVIAGIAFWWVLTELLEMVSWENVWDPKETRPDLVWGNRATKATMAAGSLAAICCLWAGWTGKRRLALCAAGFAVSMIAGWFIGLAVMF